MYYPGYDENSDTAIAINLLSEICRDDSKILCLTGESDILERAMTASGAHRVSRCYPRPVDINGFLKDINYFSELEKDFHRRKNIFVVDDDPGYLSLAESWLSPDHNVSCFQRGDAAMDGLLKVTPDLMLLDYEMPHMDGCMLKSSGKDALLSTIRRFFEDNLFRLSL